MSKCTGVVAAVLIVLVLVGWLNHKQWFRQYSHTHLLQSDQVEVVPVSPTDLCVPHDGKSPIRIELQSDHNDIFLLEMILNKQYLKMAVDTGSDSILVAGKDCDGCDRNEMNGMELPSTSGSSTTMNYGSQSDRTKLHDVSLFLRGTNLNDDAVCVHDMGKVHIVTKRSGTSDYNILGLGKEMGGGSPTFLKKLFGAPPFGFAMGIDTKKKAHITFFQPNYNPELVPQHKFTVASLQSSHHFYVHMHRMQVKDATIDTHGVSKILLDTGSNALSLPTPIFQQLRERQKSGVLHIDLQDHLGNPFPLRFAYDMNDIDNAQVLDSGHNRRIIIGVTFLVGYEVGMLDDGVERFVTIAHSGSKKI